MNKSCSVILSRDWDWKFNRAECWLLSVYFLCRALCESVLLNNGASCKKSCLNSDSMHPQQSSNSLTFTEFKGQMISTIAAHWKSTLFSAHSLDLNGDGSNPVMHLFLAQILEVTVTARDVEREHHTQLKRWKKNRGELNFKSPPRMHGARLIMLAEPPRRQDLEQNPTILLEMPTPQLRKGKEEKRSKKKRSMKKSKPIEEIPNPYSLPTDPKPPPPDQPAPPLAISKTPEPVPQTESDSPHQQQAPPTDLPPTKESPLQRSTQSLSSTEHDTYL